MNEPTLAEFVAFVVSLALDAFLDQDDEDVETCLSLAERIVGIDRALTAAAPRKMDA